MKNRFKNWWNKPITNGTIVKSSLISMGGYAALCGAMCLWYKHSMKSLYNGYEQNGEINSENI